MIKLTPLQNFQDNMVNKLKKARRTLTDHQAKLKEMRKTKVRGQQSKETKVFKVLQKIGVELSSYHGGSLNGKDIKKVMNNASHIFNQFAAIFKGGKMEECLLADADIDSMCLHFWEVYVLWDGAFSLARIINPTDEDAETYQTFILAAVSGSKILQCPITPKIHAMLRHVQWQMKNIPGGGVIKWRTGSSASINGGCNSAGDFAPCRTPLFVHLQERRQRLATPNLMCLLKWMRRTRGTSENCQKKRLMLYQSDKNCREMWGGSRRSNISLTPKSGHYHGRRYYSTMGRWIWTARTLTVWNIRVIL
jgi:hypothetical protein